MITATDPTAFDALAAAYDDDFTHSRLGQLLRPRVWQVLGRYFAAGQHVLELTCGTGEDALWLAHRGVHVTATDGSAEMVRRARAKGAAEGQTRLEFKQLSLQEIAQGYFAGFRSPAAGQPFDGVFSNFGGLNTLGEWRGLASALAKIVKPGGVVVLVPMGPVCPWEIFWYMLHGQPRQALRRFSRNGASAKIGQAVIPIWYPSAGRLRAEFAPWFQHRATQSLELWLPPSYLAHFVDRWPGLFRWLNEFENRTASLSGGWGDHYIIIFERNHN